MQDEIIFFDNGNIKVTDTRFILQGQTYVLSNIASIQMLKSQNPFRRFLYLVGFVLAFVAAILMFKGEIAGNYLLAFSVLLFIITIRLNPSYIVSIVSSGGVFAAASSKDKELIIEIIAALNKAIIKKG